MKTLTLRVKWKWFKEIKDGVKPFEFRAMSPYWCKRLLKHPNDVTEADRKKPIPFKEWDQVEIVWGYKPNSATEFHLFFPWRGLEIHAIQHEEFQNMMQKVFAIRLQPKHP